MNKRNYGHLRNDYFFFGGGHGIVYFGPGAPPPLSLVKTHGIKITHQSNYGSVRVRRKCRAIYVVNNFNHGSCHDDTGNF